MYKQVSVNCKTHPISWICWPDFLFTYAISKNMLYEMAIILTFQWMLEFILICWYTQCHVIFEYFFQVKVNHVSNASRLWVSILEHFPATKPAIPATVHDPMEFKRLSLDLAHYYSIKENKKYHGMCIYIGTPLLIDDMYVMVIVLFLFLRSRNFVWRIFL